MKPATLYSGKKLTTGDKNDPLLPKLIKAINHANEIKFSVSFIQPSGLDLLFDALVEALLRKVDIKILVSDYLCITSPIALRRLKSLQDRGAKTKLFLCHKNKSFHMKSYIFVKTENDQVVEACAFVGSNNISRTALTDAHEWCLRHDFELPNHSTAAVEFLNIRQQFQSIFEHSQSKNLTHPLIDQYTAKHKHFNSKQMLSIVDSDYHPERIEPATPNSIQELALTALRNTRKAGFKRGLVVLATGMGKTWLGAFDTKQANAKKVLFIAHREEILLQAEKTFLQLNENAVTGLFNAETKNTDCDFLFASIQTLGQQKHIIKFNIDHFDYIIIDEFHHATSPSYKNLLDYFKPIFMLGLTATPERSDQADLLSLCDNNLVFERNLVHGIDANILVPFDYHGIFDEFVNYEEIPWRNGKFDPKALDSALATKRRANHVFEQWKTKKQSRTLAFCVSTKHADYMAQAFNKKGVRACAVYNGSTIRRNEALSLLTQGKTDILFSVDLFNEGTDLPAIDTILMLRPTNSKVLFLQQLGRGLRQSLSTDKERLTVIDFIGNHNAFLTKPASLLGTSGPMAIINRINQNVSIASGCNINYDPEVIKFWHTLALKFRHTSAEEYELLKEQLGHTPTATEFFRQGYDLSKMRRQSGSWFELVNSKEESVDLSRIIDEHGNFLLEGIEKTSMTKYFKGILLSAFLELDGFTSPPTTKLLAEKSWHILNRRPDLKNKELPLSKRELDAKSKGWHSYWLSNPIRAFTTTNNGGASTWFVVRNEKFEANFTVEKTVIKQLHQLMNELVELRLAEYQVRLERRAIRAENESLHAAKIQGLEKAKANKIIDFEKYLHQDFSELSDQASRLPYYELDIAAGGFSQSKRSEDASYWISPAEIGLTRSLDENYFVSKINGLSMQPTIPDGSYCLFRFGVVGSRNNRIVLAKRDGYIDPESESSFTIKRYYSEKKGRHVGEWEHAKIELRPDNPNFQPLIITAEEADSLAIIAEFIQVLS